VFANVNKNITKLSYFLTTYLEMLKIGLLNGIETILGPTLNLPLSQNLGILKVTAHCKGTVLAFK
jgi:hypothetical protein